MSKSSTTVTITEANNTGDDEWYCDWYRCPSCTQDYITKLFKYCPWCGRKIIWNIELKVKEVKTK